MGVALQDKKIYISCHFRYSLTSLCFVPRRVEECHIYHHPNNLTEDSPCYEMEQVMRKAERNLFIKYGDLHYKSKAVDALMKQKHRMLWERRNGPVGGGDYSDWVNKERRSNMVTNRFLAGYSKQFGHKKENEDYIKAKKERDGQEAGEEQ